MRWVTPYRPTPEVGAWPPARAFSGKLLNDHEHGVFRCAGCGLDLFSSDDKFESGTGWPSFTKPIAPENITTRADNSFFMKRTEVVCTRCGGHIGHLFDDGPKPAGLRYCMNSGAMKFEELKTKDRRYNCPLQQTIFSCKQIPCDF